MSILKIITALGLIFCYILVSLSYVLNFGWFRLFFAIIFLPYFLSIIIFNFSYLIHCPVTSFQKKDICTLFFTIISFLLVNLVFPDGGDIGSPYYFFGLIKNDSDFTPTITSILFYIFLIIHIYYYSKLIINLSRLKKGLVVDK